MGFLKDDRLQKQRPIGSIPVAYRKPLCSSRAYVFHFMFAERAASDLFWELTASIRLCVCSARRQAVALLVSSRCLPPDRSLSLTLSVCLSAVSLPPLLPPPTPLSLLSVPRLYSAPQRPYFSCTMLPFPHVLPQGLHQLGVRDFCVPCERRFGAESSAAHGHETGIPFPPCRGHMGLLNLLGGPEGEPPGVCTLPLAPSAPLPLASSLFSQFPSRGLGLRDRRSHPSDPRTLRPALRFSHLRICFLPASCSSLKRCPSEWLQSKGSPRWLC